MGGRGKQAWLAACSAPCCFGVCGCPPTLALSSNRLPAALPRPTAAFGLPTAVLAAIYAALPAGASLQDQRFLLVSQGAFPPQLFCLSCSCTPAAATLPSPPWPAAHAGRRTPPLLRQVGETPRLTAIAELLEEAIQREHGRGTVLEARRILHLMDSQGLVVRDRADADELADHKLPYAKVSPIIECVLVWGPMVACRRKRGAAALAGRQRADQTVPSPLKPALTRTLQDEPPCASLLEAVRTIKPTVLIGLSDKTPPHAFGKEVRARALGSVCGERERTPHLLFVRPNTIHQSQTQS